MSLSPCRTRVLYTNRPSAYPPVSELARLELRLAGLRLDAAQHTRSRLGFATALAFAPLPPGGPPGAAVPVTGIPAGAFLNYIKWRVRSRVEAFLCTIGKRLTCLHSRSPSGTRVAFTVRGSGEAGCALPRGGCALWVADADTCVARPVLEGHTLNLSLDEVAWLSDELLVAPVVAHGGPPPSRPPAPPGPRVQTSRVGQNKEARTYADLLKDSHDVALFTHFCESRLLLVSATAAFPPVPADAASGSPPRLYTRFEASNDGRFALVEYLQPPFSFSVPAGRFPKTVQLWRLQSRGAAHPSAEACVTLAVRLAALAWGARERLVPSPLSSCLVTTYLLYFSNIG